MSKAPKQQQWKDCPGEPGIQAPLTYTADNTYVISHRKELDLNEETGEVRHRPFYILSYRPPGEHHPLLQFRSLEGAQEAADRHAAGARCTCTDIWARYHAASCPLSEEVP